MKKIITIVIVILVVLGLGYYLFKISPDQTGQPTPTGYNAALLTALFFLSSLTALVPDILGFAGNSSSFLYQLFPPDSTAVQAISGEMETLSMFRIFGFTFSSVGIISAMLARPIPPINYPPY